MKTYRAAIIAVALILLSSVVVAPNVQELDKKAVEATAQTLQNQFSTGATVDKIAIDKGNGGEDATPSEVMRQGLVSQNEDFNILLKVRKFVPEKKLSTSLKAKLDKMAATEPSARTHVLMQFERIPALEEREELKREGVDLLAYVPNNAWYVSLPAGKANQISAKSLVRAIDVIKPEYKISPYIQEGKIGKWAIDGNGDIIIIVSFHSDVPIKLAEEEIREKYSLVVQDRIELINALTISIPQESILQLAGEDSVEWIEPISPPIAPTLVDARPAIYADVAQAAPYNLSGAGVTAFVAEAGGLVDNTHSCLKLPRVTRDIDSGVSNNHATNVAGIIGARGACSFVDTNGTEYDFRGIAPSVNIYSDSIGNPSYYNSGDVQTEYDKAVNQHGVDVANNSWDTNITANCPDALCFASCSWAGDYTFTTQLFDNIVRGSLGKNLPVVFAVGNERSSGFCGTNPSNPNDNYETIAPPSTAKNVISVGAVNSIDDSMTGFSNWGPTDDLRIKPDVVAPGCGGDFALLPGFVIVYDPDADNAIGACGTSQAAPMVTGSAVLLIQQYRQLHGTDPSPSLLKALLIHTAKDLGNPGPDYQNGYGRIDVNKAVNAILNDGFKEGSISEILGSKSYYITIPQNTPELKVTLAWDDVPSTPFVVLGLINNLDLVLIDSNGVQRNPWILNPYSPSTPATTGYDFRNNVEQVYVANPNAGTWEIRVSGSPVVMPPQPYSLVSEFLGITPGGCAPSGEVRITTNISQQYYPAIYGDKIVWQDSRNGNPDIYMYDLSTSTETRITTNTAWQLNPAIYGDKIVWQDNRNGYYDIYMYDLSTSTETGVITNTINHYSPAIYGDKIVWRDSRNGNWDIYMYDLSTSTETRITTNTAWQLNPAIYGDKIVWDDNRNGNRDIYMYDLSTSTETRITTNTANQWEPAIYADKIVWRDERNGNPDIYMATLSPSCTGNQLPVATITAPADGATVAPGTNITFIGNASDAEDGSLTGSSLVWDSNINGRIGTGATFSISSLSTGTHKITFSAMDSQGGTGNDSIRLTISSMPSNLPPTISGIPDQNLIEDSGLNAGLIDLWAYASDPESSDSLLTFAIVSETNSTVVDCTIESDRNIGCVTKTNKFGYSDVTVQVSDGNSTAADTFRVNVLAVNDPPSIAGLPNQALNVNSGTNPSLIDLWGYAFDIETPDENLAFSIVSETATGVVDCTISSNRHIDCTVQPGQNGYSDVNVQVSDGELADTDVFRVTVSVVNSPPVISFSPLADPVITEEQQQLFSVSATDPDGDPMDVNWYVGAQYAGSGWSYTYVADYNSAGNRYVTAVVSDGNYSVPTEWLLTVLEVCKVPYDGMVIDSNSRLCPGAYNLTDVNKDGVVVIDGNNVALYCEGTQISGNGTGKGIVVNGYIPAEWYVDGNTERELDANKIISDEAGFEASIAYKQGITIKNCEISGYEHGLAVVGGDGITVQDVNAHDNAGAGIGFQGLRNSTIKTNIAYNNAKGGIVVQAGKNNVIELNEVYSNGGVGIASAGRADIIRNNNVHDNESGIGIGGFDMQVRNNTVLNNNTTENSTGIGALFSSNAQIVQNNVQNSQFGINLLSSYGMYVADNNVESSGTGIGIGAWLFTAGDMNSGTFERNRVLNSTKAGMYLTDGVFGIGNKFGIHDVVLQGNYFENPGVWDLHLDDKGTSYLWGVRVSGGEAIKDLNVSGNSFMGNGVLAAEGMNSFCVEGVGNTYSGGAQHAPGDCPV